MKLLFDFLPILLFFVAYKAYGIFIATAVAIAASFTQVLIYWLKNRSFEKMHLVTLGLITVLGGATLLFQERSFFMWKPTAVNWAFAVAFLGSHFIGQKTLVERMMSSAISAPNFVWSRLNISWVLFFVVMGIANLIVAGYFFEAEALLNAAAGNPVPPIDINSCNPELGQKLLALCETAKTAESDWVDFKMFGMMGMTIVFVIGQAFYLARYMSEPEAEVQTENQE
ncbi:MAG: septation protein IspZ [Gammaproteobacteria bacterium]|nr:septation protein IspZ [Gammaproteobacteria bacterium]